MTLYGSVKKLFKSLVKYSKVLFTDRHYQKFNEKCAKVKRIFQKYLKLNISFSEKCKIEALYNRLVTLKARVNNTARNNDISVKKGQNAFKCRISSTHFINHKYKSFDKFFVRNKEKVVRLLRKRIVEYKCIKVVGIFVGKFEINDRREIKYIYSSTKLLTGNTSLKRFYDTEFVPEIKTNLENFEANGSDPKLCEILNLTVNVNKCNLMRAGTYIDLPAFVKKRKAVTNVKNSDGYCFLWCLLKHFYPKHALNDVIHHGRVLSQKRQKQALPVFNKYFGNLRNFTFPMSVKSIGRFEKEKKISVNVFVIGDKSKILPFHVTAKKRKLHVNLLLIDKDGQFHYCLINDLSRLLQTQLTKCKKKIHICDRCLNYFYTKNKLQKHDKFCRQVNKCAITLPEKGKEIMEFKNFKNKLFNPFVIYYDIECILRKCAEGTAYQQHEIYCIGLYVMNRWNPEKSFYKKFAGENPARDFMLELKSISYMVEKVIFIQKKYFSITFQYFSKYVIFYTFLKYNDYIFMII